MKSGIILQLWHTRKPSDFIYFKKWRERNEEQSENVSQNEEAIFPRRYLDILNMLSAD